MSLEPAKHSFRGVKGGTFRKLITVFTEGPDSPPRDFTGYTARLDIKDGDTILLSFTDGDGLTLGGPAGTIEILIDAVQTAAAIWTSASYNLKIVDTGGSGDTDYLLYGVFTLISV